MGGRVDRQKVMCEIAVWYTQKEWMDSCFYGVGVVPETSFTLSVFKLQTNMHMASSSSLRTQSKNGNHTNNAKWTKELARIRQQENLGQKLKPMEKIFANDISKKG